MPALSAKSAKVGFCGIPGFTTDIYMQVVEKYLFATGDPFLRLISCANLKAAMSGGKGKSTVKGKKKASVGHWRRHGRGGDLAALGVVLESPLSAAPGCLESGVTCDPPIQLSSWKWRILLVID